MQRSDHSICIWEFRGFGGFLVFVLLGCLVGVEGKGCILENCSLLLLFRVNNSAFSGFSLQVMFFS